ncbi:MAG: hypothetical protein M1374_01310 [Firmicutes bacterium]|nr:hypothetical protein [Bacillota bacterium]
MSNFDIKNLKTRLLAKDATLWPEGNVSQNRLGWIDVIKEMHREAKDLKSWAENIDQETIVLIGMGGSSLGPLVLSTFAGTLKKPNGRRMVVLDTTSPHTVENAPIEDAFILVSSKSGTTLEPNDLMAHARSRMSDFSRYAFITDPNTELSQLGSALGVNKVFSNRSDIGGRYSVLSYFGLVPAALMGYDIAELCEAAADLDPEEAITLGVEAGRAALEGMNKLTIQVPDQQRVFGLWIEQLVAESTGKHGIGCVPVPTSDKEAGSDRFHIELELRSAGDLGAQFYKLEVATAIIGHVLNIDPFDEPNVAESKANTNKVLSNLPIQNIENQSPDALDVFLKENVKENDYISIQAYLPYGSEEHLEQLRVKLRDAHNGTAVTAGYGPRFLHSTGQLHKGGPNQVVAVQIVERSPYTGIEIPGKNYDFATLITAQSIGDYQSLQAHQRRVIRIGVDQISELL